MVRAAAGVTPFGAGRRLPSATVIPPQHPIHKKDMTRDCCCTLHLHHILCSAHTYTRATARSVSFIHSPRDAPCTQRSGERTVWHESSRALCSHRTQNVRVAPLPVQGRVLPLRSSSFRPYEVSYQLVTPGTGRSSPGLFSLRSTSLGSDGPTCFFCFLLLIPFLFLRLSRVPLLCPVLLSKLRSILQPHTHGPLMATRVQHVAV